MTINEIAEYYSTEEIADVLEKYRIKNETALIIALKIERWHKLRESIDKNKRIELLKNIRNQYGFPIWLINEALKYYNNDEDRAVERLNKIYCAAGDHPDIVIEKNIEKFMDEIRYSKVNKGDTMKIKKDTESKSCDTCSCKSWDKWKYPCSVCVGCSMWSKRDKAEVTGMKDKSEKLVAEKCEKCEKFYRSKYQEPCCSAYKVILPCGDKPYCK